jgi:hypothetical protein
MRVPHSLTYSAYIEGSVKNEQDFESKDEEYPTEIMPIPIVPTTGKCFYQILHSSSTEFFFLLLRGQSPKWTRVGQ